MRTSKMENNLRNIYNKYKDVLLQDFDMRNASNYWYCLGKKYSLPVDILLDTSEEYRVRNEEPVLLFRNGYNNNAEFLKIEISDDPNISDILPLLKIYSADFYKVYVFVVKHFDKLLQLANEEIEIREFDREVFQLKEGLLTLNEMAKLTPNQTGLAAKIWIDNGNTASHSGHNNSDRIKFQNPKEEKDSHNWSELIIKGLRIVSSADIEWSSEEMENLYRFVEANAEMIHQAMRENWSDDKILSKVIRLDDKGELIYPKEESSFMIVEELGFGYRKVRNVDCQFNVIDESGNLISDEWFDHIGTFKENQNQFVNCYRFVSNSVWKLFPNGNITKQI